MPLIIPSNSISAGGYEVDNSLRFNDGSSDSLNKTFGTPSNNKIHTTSVWFKRSSGLGVNQSITYVEQGGGYARILLHNSDAIIVDGADSSAGNSYGLTTNRLFRDVSAWYHIVVAFDDTQSTASDRLKLYVNGVQETSFSSSTYPTQNIDYPYNSANAHYIGRNTSGATYYDGYLAEYCFIDGSQLDATSFGEFDEDSGIWKPIDVSGLTFGTNGFYLDFEDSAALGDDVSGNGNNFTVNNLTAVDQSTDTCTNNYVTWNPLDNYYPAMTLSEGNTKAVTVANKYTHIPTTIGITSGKWYAEIKCTAQSASQEAFLIGISSTQSTATTQELGHHANDYSYYANDGSYRNNDTNNSYGSSFTTGDIIGIAVDLDNNKLYFSKNGIWQNSGDPTSGATGTGAISITDPTSTPRGAYFFAVCYWSSTNNGTFDANFGNPSFTISSGNTDGNGYGNFEYAVPSGYYALNTKNLAEYG